MLAVTLGATGVVLNQLFIWPQVWRARRTLEGVSLLTALSGVLARLAWSVYGWQTGDVALIAGNVTVTVGFLFLVVMLARGEVASWPRVTISTAAVVAGVLAAATSTVVLAWVAVLSAGVVVIPQLVRALAEPDRLAGVSTVMYVLVATASACWLAYGIVVDDLIISAPHFVLLPTAMLTAWLAARAHATADGPWRP
ncbi:MAG: hypothetical protein WKF76_07375 [Nocardioidaceae bacterium]